MDKFVVQSNIWHSSVHCCCDWEPVLLSCFLHKCRADDWWACRNRLAHYKEEVIIASLIYTIPSILHLIIWNIGRLRFCRKNPCGYIWTGTRTDYWTGQILFNFIYLKLKLLVWMGRKVFSPSTAIVGLGLLIPIKCDVTFSSWHDKLRLCWVERKI